MHVGYVYLTDLLTVQYHTHTKKSKLTATITWTCRNDRTRVDSWKLRVRNLTWEQNDYEYVMKEIECQGGDLHYYLRYKTTVFNFLIILN